MSFYLQRALIEVRFSTIINTQNMLSKLENVSNSLRRLYGNSNFDFTNKSFVLSNSLEGCNCVLQPDKLVIESQSPKTIESFCKLIEDTLKEFRTESLFEDLSRIGFRTFYGQEYKTLEAAKDALSKCFDFTKTGANNFSNKFIDTRVGFSIGVDEYKVNFNFNTAINREMNLIDGNLQLNKEIFCIIADLDTYIDQNCRYSSIFNYLNKFKNLTNKHIAICNGIMRVD